MFSILFGGCFSDGFFEVAFSITFHLRLVFVDTKDRCDIVLIEFKQGPFDQIGAGTA